MGVIHFLLYNGIGQNITASALLAVPTLVFGWRKVLPRIREHERKVHELHARVERLNAHQATQERLRMQLKR